MARLASGGEGWSPTILSGGPYNSMADSSCSVKD